MINRNEKGIALILVLGVLAVLATLATTFAFNMRLEQKAARNYLESVTAEAIARAGVEHAIARLRYDRESSSTNDAYTESWHTSFTGDVGVDRVVDNDGDGNNDSKWIGLHDMEGNLIGAYAIYVVDELSKININWAGNISGGSEAQGQNQGWTASEINLEALPGITSANGLRKNIVKYRYGYGSDEEQGESDVDDDNDATPTGVDGIDNDGDGSSDEAGEGTDEPDEYVPGYRYGTDDADFASIEQIKLVDGITDSIFWNDTSKTGIKNMITAYSAYSSQERYYSGGWQDRININAVRESGVLYNMIDDTETDEASRRYAANIIDYGDVDYIPTVCQTLAGQNIYGIEGLQINEVMCYVTPIPRENNAAYVTYLGDWDNSGAIAASVLDGDSGTWEWPFDNGTYTVVIEATGGGGIAYSYDIEGVSGTASGSATQSITVADSKITLTLTDGVDAPNPLVASTFDKITVDAGNFLEIINLSELDITIANNWTIRKGDMSSSLSLDSSTSVTANKPSGTTFDYVVFAHSLYAIDYMRGNNDGDWDAADAPWGSDDTIFCGTMDLANAGEAIALYDSNNDLVDIVHVNTANNDYGTVNYSGASITQDKSRVRSSPINDSASWIDSTSVNGTFYQTLGANNNGATTDTSWYIHDGPFANVGLIGNVPTGTGAATTLDQTHLDAFVEKLTVSARRIEAEDATTIPWGSPDTGIDGTTRYVAPAGVGPWTWTWKDGTISGGDAQVRLIDGEYYIFVCGGYPNADFISDGEDRKVRPNSLAYAGDVTVSGKQFSLVITGDGTDTPKLDYVLLVPKKNSPGRLGRININTAFYDGSSGDGVLEGLPGIDNTLEATIVSNRPYTEIGDLCNSLGANLSEAQFAPIANLVTVRSDIFKIYCTARAINDLNGDGAYDVAGDIVLGEKKVEVIIDRSPLDVTNGKIRILLWQVKGR